MKNFLQQIFLCGLLLTCALQLQGCAVAALTAAAAYAFDDSEEKAAFHKNNLEREKAGLKPLTKDEWENMKNSGESNKKKESKPKKTVGGAVDKR